MDQETEEEMEMWDECRMGVGLRAGAVGSRADRTRMEIQYVRLRHTCISHAAHL